MNNSANKPIHTSDNKSQPSADEDRTQSLPFSFPPAQEQNNNDSPVGDGGDVNQNDDLDNIYVLVPLAKLKEAEKFSEGIRFLLQNDPPKPGPILIKGIWGDDNAILPYSGIRDTNILSNQTEQEKYARKSEKITLNTRFTTTGATTNQSLEQCQTLPDMSPGLVTPSKRQDDRPLYLTPPSSHKKARKGMLADSYLFEKVGRVEDNDRLVMTPPRARRETTTSRLEVSSSSRGANVNAVKQFELVPYQNTDNLMTVEELGNQLIRFGKYFDKTRRWVYDTDPDYVNSVLEENRFLFDKYFRGFALYVHKRQRQEERETLYQLQRGSEIVSFGKYRGKTYEWVYDHQRGYCDWCLALSNPANETQEFIDYVRARDRIRKQQSNPNTTNASHQRERISSLKYIGYHDL